MVTRQRAAQASAQVLTTQRQRHQSHRESGAASCEIAPTPLVNRHQPPPWSSEGDGQACKRPQGGEPQRALPTSAPLEQLACGTDLRQLGFGQASIRPVLCAAATEPKHLATAVDSGPLSAVFPELGRSPAGDETCAVTPGLMLSNCRANARRDTYAIKTLATSA